MRIFIKQDALSLRKTLNKYSKELKSTNQITS